MLPKEGPDAFFKLPQKKMQRIDSLSDQIACSKVCIKNFKWKEATEDFPMTPNARHVDKFYPFAMNGKGLYIDEPQYPDSIKFCEEKKRPILEKRGYRYLVIKKETTLEELLEEIQKWHGPRS